MNDWAEAKPRDLTSISRIEGLPFDQGKKIQTSDFHTEPNGIIFNAKDMLKKSINKLNILGYKLEEYYGVWCHLRLIRLTLKDPELKKILNTIDERPKKTLLNGQDNRSGEK